MHFANRKVKINLSHIEVEHNYIINGTVKLVVHYLKFFVRSIILINVFFNQIISTTFYFNELQKLSFYYKMLQKSPTLQLIEKLPRNYVKLTVTVTLKSNKIKFNVKIMALMDNKKINTY